MKCPHCLIEVNPAFKETYIGADDEGYWSVFMMNCPNKDCKKLIVNLASGEVRGRSPQGQIISISPIKLVTVRPFVPNRSPIPPEVEKKFAQDYIESATILQFSPKASAAISRRILQIILREKAGVKKGDLASEIQEVIDGKTLPGYLIDSIDAVRNVGNFAAHPIKSQVTGEIVEVEPGEAEWLLDVIESLFDFYFVQPMIIKTKRDDLNKKLADAGKPPLK